MTTNSRQIVIVLSVNQSYMDTETATVGPADSALLPTQPHPYTGVACTGAAADTRCRSRSRSPSSRKPAVLSFFESPRVAQLFPTLQASTSERRTDSAFLSTGDRRRASRRTNTPTVGTRVDAHSARESLKSRCSSPATRPSSAGLPVPPAPVAVAVAAAAAAAGVVLLSAPPGTAAAVSVAAWREGDLRRGGRSSPETVRCPTA
eukprot:GHVU01070922.1.p1 GENE.GHVU01070922.1~~GHVU01070922.1.p1  ORF type:complete len:205 (-),score=22.57 GHVU01070922.1:377-991(-)